MTSNQLPGAAAGFDAAVGRYGSTGTGFFTPLAAALLEATGIQPGTRVLDIGCGKGAATLPAAQAAGAGGQVTGLDGSPGMLAHAGEAARRAGLDTIRWLHGDAEDPPLPPGSQDVVLSSSVIQFLADPRAAAGNWLPLLTPGGTLALSWGLAQDPAWIPVMAVYDRAVPAPHPGFEKFLRRPPFDSPDSVDQFLDSCGYTGVTTRAKPITSIYASHAQWWAETRGQGPYVVSWKHIPAGALERAHSEASALLEGMRGEDGMIRRTLRFGITIARRPLAG